MKTLISTISALALGATSIAGCSMVPGGTPTVSPQVSAAEQSVYDWICPTLLSGELDPVAALWPSDLPAYNGAKQLCSNGVILVAGTFIADFLAIEPIVAQYFTAKGQKATFNHYSKLAHRG